MSFRQLNRVDVYSLLIILSGKCDIDDVACFEIDDSG